MCNITIYGRKKKYCTEMCRMRHYNSHLTRGTDQAISTGSFGALSELMASQHLILQNFHVFRAVSPSCPCDLVVMKNQLLLRVEVTTGRRHVANQKIHFPAKDTAYFDILAVVVIEENLVVFTPDLSSFTDHVR